MSHFTVLVTVKPDLLEQHDGDLVAAVTELMAPYQENNMDNCPQEFLEFNDEEDKMQEEYNEGTWDLVRIPKATFDARLKDLSSYHKDQAMRNRFQDPERLDGWLVSKWNDILRIPGTVGLGGKTHSHEGFDVEEFQYSCLYDTMEEFAKDYHGYKSRDAQTGRFGYWENPNSRWDYWRIGGRWQGILPVKETAEKVMGDSGWDTPDDPDDGVSASAAQAKDIDFELMNRQAEQKMEEFLKNLGKVKAFVKKVGGPEKATGPALRKAGGKEWTELEWGAVSRMIDVGLAEWYPVPDEKAKVTEESQAARTLKIKEVSDAEIRMRYKGLFQFGTFAALDEDGWHEKGRMGWFACHSATAEEAADWERGFVDRFMMGHDPETWLVVCDCHV